MCPALSYPQDGYELSENNLCKPCKPGYFYNASDPVVGRRCVPCAEGFFCPSRDEHVECPTLATFKRDGGYVTVPTTLSRAYRSEHCNCSAAGGFEPSPYSQALFGCVPCSDGTYSPPGAVGCASCPAGKYASQVKGATNYRACPASDSPSVSFYGAAGTSGAMSVAACSATPPAFLMDVGATACTDCPADRPYTWQQGSKSVGECRCDILLCVNAMKKSFDVCFFLAGAAPRAISSTGGRSGACSALPNALPRITTSRRRARRIRTGSARSATLSRAIH